MSSYDTLIQKLDQFIRKFYVNKLIKGSLYTIGLVLALFILFNVLEYNFYFSTTIRKVLFGSFIATSLFALTAWVLIPLSKFFSLGKTISHQQAALIIGDHFAGVKDKLLNVLQLKEQENGSLHFELLEASIEQKTKDIKLVPFKNAIDFAKNKQYLKYAIPPILALVAIVLMAPSIITESTHRIINNDKEFERAAPYSFVVDDNNPKVVQFEDYVLNVQVEGEILPNEVFVEVESFQYRLQKTDASNFTYTFRNVQKDTDFKIVSGKVASDTKSLTVLAKPNLANFDIEAKYPGYVGRRNEVISNLGDLVVPEGTRLSWLFNTVNTDDVVLKFASKKDEIAAERKGDNDFIYSQRIRNNDSYKVFISNSNVPNGDSVSYTINVIKDQYPTVAAQKFEDSLDQTVVYFVGNAGDDYGLRSLTFNYTITDESGRSKPLNTIKLKDPDGRETQFDYTFDINALELQPGDNVSYYFEVKDNDGVNGSKSAKTGIMTFKKPSIDELKEEEEQNEEEIKENLKESVDDIKKLNENFKKMREKLLQEKELDWQDKKDLEKLLEEQRKLQEKVEEAKEKFEKNLEKQEQFNEQPEEIQEKQERLKEMFEEAVNPEQKELMDKIQELMQELQKDEALQMMEEMEMNNETTEKEMERLEELYKQLELEKEVKETMEELEKLAEEQEELAEKTEEEKGSKEELKKEQEELNEKMEKIEEKMKELEKKNEELKNPKNLGDDNEEQMDDIQEDMEDAGEKMEQQDSKGASSKQKSAAQKMKKMAGSLQSNMEGGEEEQQAEDIKAIRQLLENLVNLSFDQENLVDDLTVTRTVTPRYVELVQEQFKLQDDFKMVEDSLNALAMRNDKIETFVLDKVAEIKLNIRESIDELEERKTGQAADNQRRSMKNINDLALMLSESMEDMQQSMSSSMPGSQMCQKPGNKPGGKDGKKPMDKISKGSQGMKESLEGMQQKMQGGQKPSAKDFAQAAARQAAMRKALEDMQKDAREQGQGDPLLDKIIEEMNKVETDLVNKKLDSETLKRQQNILTRLLEAEKAQRQREFDNKRKAEVGTDKKRELPPSLQEYLKKREAEVEMYKTVSPALRPYYRNLVNQYYQALKKE